jgi:hypothetical protein
MTPYVVPSVRFPMKLFFSLSTLLWLPLLTAEIPIPEWFPVAPPLPPPSGQVLRVETPTELLEAIDRVESGGTILLADGQYQLPRTMVLREKRDVTIRGSAGDPRRVLLSGRGWDSMGRGDDILHISGSDGVIIADLTFRDCHSYGIKVEAETAPRNIHIRNCHFRDIGTRAIKGSANTDPELRAVHGSIRFCWFENTRVPGADGLFDGDYIAAIDMMALDDWTISDNVFHNLRGRNGGGRAAIFLWVRSRNIVVERNLIVDCDRGVAFGNPGSATAQRAGEQPLHVSDGIIRNNFIAGGADCGIELWHAANILVAHNSVWRPQRNWNRGVRIGTGTVRTTLANNLVHGGIVLEGGDAQLHENLAGRVAHYFTNPTTGNLILTAEASGAIRQGLHLPAVPDDIRRRPRSPQPDLGAWETTPSIPEN